jgi:4a-hydroxytetrahydrobiopterin dehydratase
MTPRSRRPMPKKLTEAEVASALKRLEGWTLEGQTIRKLYTFKAFADGIRFVDRVAVEADAMDHHPDIDIRYTTIVVALSTHSAGGLTTKDLELAELIDRATR